LKDSLPTNDPAKVIKGAEFSTEFTAIQTAFGQAAPLASPTFTGTVTTAALNASGNVGIGTASPASKLSIASGDILLDNTRSIIFKDSGGVARGILQYFSDNSTYLDAPNGNTIFRNGASNTEKMRITLAGNVGIGTTSPQGILEVVDTNPILQVRDSTTSAGSAAVTLRMGESDGSGNIENYWDIKANGSDGALQFIDNWDGGSGTGTRMVIDDSGNLLIGKTSAGAADGVEILPSGQVAATRDSNPPLFLRRDTSDGSLVDFNKDGTTVGSIGTSGGDIYIDAVSGAVGLLANSGSGSYGWTSSFIYPTADNTRDLGTSSFRFKDLHLGGNALIGTTAVTGSLSNTTRVTGGIFSTNNGTTSVPNATWTTLATIPTGDGIYLVTAYLPSSGDPASYNAVSIVTTSLTGTNLVDIKNANQVALRMSGSNLQVNHGQGTTQPINWSILRLA